MFDQNNPELYDELNSHVYPNRKAAEAALEAFSAELYEIRKKYCIPDVTVITMINYAGPSGRTLKQMDHGHIGFGMMAGPMLSAAVNKHMQDLAEKIGDLAEKLTQLGEKP